MELKVNYYKDIEKLNEGEDGWYQLRCAENVYFHNGEKKCISLGMSIGLPENCEVHVYANKYLHDCGLMTVTTPVIFDKLHNRVTMNREWELCVFCFNEHGAMLHKGDVIGEFRIVEHHNVNFKEGE